MKIRVCINIQNVNNRMENSGVWDLKSEFLMQNVCSLYKKILEVGYFIFKMLKFCMLLLVAFLLLYFGSELHIFG